MSKRLPHQILWEARQLADQHRMYIMEFEKRDRMGRPVLNPETHQPIPVYVLYRRLPGDTRGEELARSGNPATILSKVRHAAGVAA